MEGLDTLLKSSLLPETFSTLTNLTNLEMRENTTTSVAPVITLPGLSRLCLYISEQDSQPRDLVLQSTEMTYLSVWGAKQLSVSQQSPPI